MAFTKVTTAGIETSGTVTIQNINVTGVSTFGSSIYLGDGDVAYFGDGQDLLIFHNSTDSLIRDSGTGDLFLQGGNAIRMTNPTGIETYATFNQDGAVELWFDNSKKLETTGAGITVTGTTFSNQLSVSGVSTFTNGPVIVGAATSTGTATQRLQVTGGAYVSGSLGIGTTNPQNTVHNYNTSYPTFSADAGSNKELRLQFHTGDNTANLTSIGAFPLVLQTNSIERVRITSGGNVGIGTINPVEMLQIFKNGGDNYIRIDAGGTNGGKCGIKLVEQNILYGWEITHDSFTDKLDILHNPNSGTYSPSSKVTFLPSGNVGIGTINPSHRLSVYGITSGGNVGIGTINPVEMLQIFKNGGDNYIRIDAGGTNGGKCGIKLVEQNILYGWEITHDSFTDKLDILHNPNSGTYSPSSKVTFLPSGNVGIGTINPSHRLSVYGTGAVRNEIVSTDNNAGGAGVYLRTLNGATQVSNATLRTTNSGTFEVYTGTSAETLKLSVDTSGNLITPNNIGGGLDIGYKKFVSITGSFSANTWYNTGIDRTSDIGIYLLNAWVDTYNTGQSYQMTYTGLFALPNRGSNSGDATTITLHRAGHAPNAETIQFRTLLTSAASGGIIYLQWLSNVNLTLDGSAGRNIQVAIHRLTTPLNNG